MNPIYLDYCATSPLLPEVRSAMQSYLAHECTGHASSVHTAGRAAEAIVSRARGQLASLLNVRSTEIVFTGSGTEANNLAIKGTAEALRERGRGDHLILTTIEHESVIGPGRYLESHGFRVSWLDVDLEGRIDLAKVERLLTPDTIMISAMMANHETGILLPVRELAERAHAVGALMHSDASMAVGRMDVLPRELDVDMLTVSAHKFGGPQGVGALYIRRGLKLSSQMHGGHHERNRRAGSEHVLGILGMGEAAEAVARHPIRKRLLELTEKLWAGIQDRIRDVRLNRSSTACPGILNVEFKGVEGESVLMNLDICGIYVSAGSPCSSGSLEPSPVLVALGLGEDRARSCVRFSMGPGTTSAEIDRLLNTLPGIVERLRTLMSG